MKIDRSGYLRQYFQQQDKKSYLNSISGKPLKSDSKVSEEINTKSIDPLKEFQTGKVDLKEIPETSDLHTNCDPGIYNIKNFKRKPKIRGCFDLHIQEPVCIMPIKSPVKDQAEIKEAVSDLHTNCDPGNHDTKKLENRSRFKDCIDYGGTNPKIKKPPLLRNPYESPPIICTTFLDAEAVA